MSNRLWMNDEDMRVCSHFFKGCMLILSPKIDNHDIRGFLLVPKNNFQFQKKTRFTNE